MPILAITASFRKHGNTASLLKGVLSGLATLGLEAETIDIAQAAVAPCTGCNACFNSGQCVIADGMQDIYQALSHCRGLIVAAPLYFLGPPAQLKAVIDRCQAFWARSMIRKQPLRPSSCPGMFISTAGARGQAASFRCSRTIIKAWFSSVGVSYIHELLIDNSDHCPTHENDGAMAQAHEAGIHFGRCIGAETGP